MAKKCYVCDIEYDLSEVEGAYLDFSPIFKKYPKSLFKFFSNTVTVDDKSEKSVNYSYEALTSNTVYLENPNNYNDPYDSRLRVDDDRVIKERIQFYLSSVGEKYNKSDDLSR